MRRFALLSVAVVLVLVSASCGGGEPATTTSSTASAQPDPGRTAVDALLAAASQHDAQALWSLLSTPSRKRLGPTFAAFKSTSATKLERALKPFVGFTGKPFVSQRISDLFGVVAIHRGAAALEFPLRSVNGSWRVEAPGPVTIDIGGPQPGSRTLVGQIGIEIHAPGPPSVGLIWVDGASVEPKIYTGKKSATVYANLDQPLASGVHIAVAYAEEGRDAAALAWAFTATKS